MIDRAAEARVDQALVARILAADDRRAFEQLLRRHQGMVRAQLRRLLHGDEAQADDLAQDVFLLVWRKLHQFRGDARFSTWIYRIAYSCFLQAQRKRLPVHSDVRDEPATTPPQAIDLKLDVANAMRHLSEAEQAVLLHCVQMGLSHDEAAYVLAMPVGTVKSHAARGKARLRTWLAAWRETNIEERR